MADNFLVFFVISSHVKESLPIKLNDLDNVSEQHATHYEDIIKRLHDIVKSLPSANFYTAGKLIRHLKRFEVPLISPCSQKKTICFITSFYNQLESLKIRTRQLLRWWPKK